MSATINFDRDTVLPVIDQLVDDGHEGRVKTVLRRFAGDDSDANYWPAFEALNTLCEARRYQIKDRLVQ